MSNNYYFIRFGEFTTKLLPFDHQMSLEKIEEHAHTWFDSALKNGRHIKFYSKKAKTLLVLTDDILKGDYNPFATDIPVYNENDKVYDLQPYVELLIVDDSNATPAINLSCTMPSSSALAQNEASSSTMLSNQIQLNGIANVITREDQTSVPDDDNNDYIEKKIMEENLRNLVQYHMNHNKTLNDNPNDPIVALRFTHDVNEYQKDNYLTNAFRVTSSGDNNTIRKTKTGIGFVQGSKTPDQERFSVSPKIHGLQQFQNEPDLEMYIYGVHETMPIAGGDRVWNIHRDRKFLLPIELKRDAIPYNPMKLKLNEISLNDKGEFDLNMYMLTKWEKQEIEKELYELNETETLRLHSAPHQSSRTKSHIPPVRLLVMVKRADSSILKAIGLSNFIQPPRTLPKTNLSIDKAVEIDQQKSNKRKKN